MRLTVRLLAALLALSAATGTLVACSSDSKETVTSVKDQAADEVGEAGVRGAAEAYRVALKADDAAQEDGVRDVAVLQENAKDLPGDAEVIGIDDADGDGKDDDGKVEVKVSDKLACVTLPETGNEVDVTDGAC